ncbi:MAG: YihY/virulence factor BrkB family protein [Pseudomonadota bacterium]
MDTFPGDRDGTLRAAELDPSRLPYHVRLRGRAAVHPLQIGWRGWADIVARIWERIGIDNIGLIVAGVTFYIFLALIPATIAVVTFYGLVTDSLTLQSHVAFLKGYLPDQAILWIGEEVARIAAFREEGLSLAFGLSLALSFWAMNNAVVAWFGAMNVAFGELEKRSIIGLYLRCFAFTTIALVVGIVMVATIVLLPLLLPTGTYGGRQVTAPILFVLVTVGAAAIYRLGPSRRPAKLRWVMFGALCVAAGWIGASTLLSWYLSNFANYAAMYGSLGTVVALLFWLYISVYILMVGAWLNAEIEHQTLVDTTVGSAKPLGERGAHVADTVGRALTDRR